jgi:hypothetical protein
LPNSLSKGKRHSEEDRKLPVQMERLRRVSHAITQSKDKLNNEIEETAEQVFSSHEELKTVCQISQNFKQRYDISRANLKFAEKKNSEVKNSTFVVRKIRFNRLTKVN